MLTQRRSVDFYARPGLMTSAGGYAALLADLPRDIAVLRQIVQGVLIHEHLAPYAYGETLSDERRAETHIRPVERMLELLATRGAYPLAGLPPSARVVGTCRDFSVLLVAMLRAQGTPARARCGFGGYFRTGTYEDHWVAEYWEAARACWVRVDAQIDPVQQQLFRVECDLLDVPHDQFVIAGDAWAQCRAGLADPAKFGLSMLGEGGLWFIAGDLLRDAAALNNMEMLPWDVWGAMPAPNEPLDEGLLVFFDHVAALTRAPERSFDELRALYESDPRLRVPDTVFNAVLQRTQSSIG